MTCRCPICSRNDAGSNRTRKSYLRCGIVRDEHGRDDDGFTKKQTRKIRRVREGRAWKKEIFFNE